MRTERVPVSAPSWRGNRCHYENATPVYHGINWRRVYDTARQDIRTQDRDSGNRCDSPTRRYRIIIEMTRHPGSDVINRPIT